MTTGTGKMYTNKKGEIVYMLEDGIERKTMFKNTTISSKSLRAERRIKTLKALLSHALDILKISLGVAVGIGILWIIQVGVTSI